jgi:acetyl-CoA carboxylase carboxyl transferase subunit alpha
MAAPLHAVPEDHKGHHPSWRKLGILPALDYWVSAVQTFMSASAETNHSYMEAASKAQVELQKIEKQIEHLESAAGDNKDAHRQLQDLLERVSNLRRQITSAMGPWQKVELARHPQRPYTLDFIERIFTDFSEIHGDRGFADDPAIICGMARLDGQEVFVLGTQKGRDTKQKVYRNFGMPSPEGYRKALRAMRIAEKFGRPIFSFVDTPGAYPGLGAEERGQAEAIAHNLREMAGFKVPVIVTITGEGGSGGALAIAIGDRVNMMENAIYSVISPEGCASIMWRDATKRDVAATAMRITAKDMDEMGIIDTIIPEPPSGAHTDHEAAAEFVGAELRKQLAELKSLSLDEMLKQRYDKFRKMAQYFKEG